LQDKIQNILEIFGRPQGRARRLSLKVQSPLSAPFKIFNFFRMALVDLLADFMFLKTAELTDVGHGILPMRVYTFPPMATTLCRKRRRPSFHIITRLFVKRDIKRKRSDGIQKFGEVRFKNRQRRYG